ncbi:GNAT family N-acetyltransferase [Georgenia sp. TF02-10]|uniref:GNAT family N-acetyltransferase n=1 Tax=Georgenia sp. TF02-10 TaxID=2917725 RepID=UPI001FA6C8D0|nr:GNAT family protein [Georgenia sp. TF02-10]UNX55076.1 GNAT family N-acetyltransferase [Georgenia sp. TF02-10]
MTDTDHGAPGMTDAAPPALTTSDAARAYGRDLLVGRHVRLRPLADADLPVLDRWWQDPQWQVLQQGSVLPRPAGPAGEQFRSWSGNAGPGSVGFCVETLAEGQLAGHIVVFGAGLPARAGTLAVILGPPFTGRGLGPDAVDVMLGYAFREMGLNRVELRVWAFNTDAIRAYERCGFVVEGRRREAAFHDGRFHDEVLMGVLAREWEHR